MSESPNIQRSDLLPYRADYHPVLGQLMKELGFPDVINDIVESPNSQAVIDAGTFVALFIHHMLGDMNIKMYRMHEFFQDKALPLLIPWNPNIDLAEINDDRAGRVLDAIWNANPQKVFSTVVDFAIRSHSLETDVIHGDTTSKSFQGAYDDQIEEIGIPFITQGCSKDHRPDLKQLVFGVGTTNDGVPLIGEITNGNESDMTLNGRWVKKLRTMLQKDPDDFLLYIADSSLVTTDNLRLRHQENIDIISRLPGRFGLEGELKRKALANNSWEDIGKISPEKNAAFYRYLNTTGCIDGRDYRFVVVHSDSKDKRKLKSLDKSVRKEHKKGSGALKDLTKRPFVCQRDAEIEAERFLKESSLKYHDIDWNIESREEKVKRKKRGRPKKGDIIPTKTRYYLSGSLRINEENYTFERELCGLFVLITTLMDIEEYPAGRILREYKGQMNVERIFKFIKNPAWVGSFCLKTPERIAALGYVLLMAAVIYTLWERRVRKALSKEGVKPIRGLNQQKTKKPTAYALQTVLSGILVQSQKSDNELTMWLPKPLNINQKRVVEFSGYSEEIYHGEWRINKKI
ncbi:MAG: IS1634 family transposase [Thermoplasmata archaeon]